MTALGQEQTWPAEPKSPLVTVTVRLDHPERNHILFVTGFKAKLRVELVRFGGRGDADKRVVAIRNRHED